MDLYVMNYSSVVNDFLAIGTETSVLTIGLVMVEGGRGGG